MSQVFTEKTKEKYIKKKLQDLRQFGYPKLTEDEVRQQLEKVLNNEPINVIGMFIKSDVVKR
jgi:hypothetical protein